MGGGPSYSRVRGSRLYGAIDKHNGVVVGGSTSELVEFHSLSSIPLSSHSNTLNMPTFT